MKVALILPGSIWYAPYVRIYTRILDEQKVDYNIISWNREGDDKAEGFQYNELCKKGHGSAGFFAYKGYIKFIKLTIKEQGFDKIIVFGPQMTCLLSGYLLRKFRYRYMLDYRDLSIEQKLGFKQLYSIMLKYSCVNVISSPGFKQCLPKRDYYLSHNFDVNAVKSALCSNIGENFNYSESINVLTIGAIRDFTSNIKIVKALGNKDGFYMSFVGKGNATSRIEAFCKEKEIKNFSMAGFYHKSEEVGFVERCTYMNIFYPRIISHDTALSNRFYNSLIYKKPMIVTKDTTQGVYVEKYKVGVAVENCNNLDKSLLAFLESDYKSYAQRCNQLLKIFLKDQEEFENAVNQFIK